MASDPHTPNGPRGRRDNHQQNNGLYSRCLFLLLKGQILRLCLKRERSDLLPCMKHEGYIHISPLQPSLIHLCLLQNLAKRRYLRRQNFMHCLIRTCLDAWLPPNVPCKGSLFSVSDTASVYNAFLFHPRCKVKTPTAPE